MGWFQNYFSNIQWEELFTGLLNQGVRLLLSVILLTVIYRVALSLAKAYFRRSEKKNSDNIQRTQTMASLVRNIISYTYYFFMGYTILALLGVPVATLIAGAGVASLAIGFGAQGLVSDTVNGFFILLEHQYDVGDWVILGDIEGSVTQLGLKTTVVTGFDGSVNYIPNREISVVRNLSREAMRLDIDLTYYADTDMETYRRVVTERLDEVAADDPHLLSRKPLVLGPTRNGDNRFVFKVRVWIDDSYEPEERSRYYGELYQALADANIQVPDGVYQHLQYLPEATSKKHKK